MASATFPVLGDHLTLGSVQVPMAGMGETIWPVAQAYAGRQYQVAPNTITIAAVLVDGGTLSPPEAATKPVTALAAQHAKVVVQSPPGALPPWQQPLQQQQQQMQQLQQQMQQQQQLLQQQQQQMQVLTTRTNKIALQALVDEVRTKLYNGPLAVDERTSWNTRLSALSEEQLQGLTRAQALLTKYGPYTAQAEGAHAAHDVSVREMAEAVTSSRNNDYRRLFKFLHPNEDPPHTIVFGTTDA